MPVKPTYPGVYIEEVPSGVRTITGVATSITAFVGYTSQGEVNKPKHLFSFADFDREFGGITPDSVLSHTVNHFFQNGGTEAYVVRTVKGAVAASVGLKNAKGDVVLTLTARSEGVWGHNLRIRVQEQPQDPGGLFTLSVTELVEEDDGLKVVGTEAMPALSMNPLHPNFAPAVITSRSRFVRATVPAGFAITGKGTSVSGNLTEADLATLADGYRVAFVLDGVSGEVSIAKAPTGTDLATKLASASSDIATAISNVTVSGVTGSVDGGARLKFESKGTGPSSSIRFVEASRDSGTATLKLGVANGGTEVDAAAPFRPVSSGTTGVSKDLPPTTAAGSLEIEVFEGGTTRGTTSVPLWGGSTGATQPTTWPDLLSLISDRLAEPEKDPKKVNPVRGSTLTRTGTAVVLLPEITAPNRSFKLSGDVAKALGLDAGTRNVGAYVPGIGVDALSQAAGARGNPGTPPGDGELTGSESAKTGMYALQDVDVFNLLVMPEATQDRSRIGVLSAAIKYCERRRAFMIIDTPEAIDTFAKAEEWIGATDAAVLRSRNSGLFFPRLSMPDPLNQAVIAKYPAAGALAGIFARTDAERGVWKAPAGISATVAGATGLAYKLTDGENGALNPMGLNCLRVFPVIGVVNWGARTGRGADGLADEYKYVPVRRLALYLEESLYRGTQWVVFEPNDEPLWAQIRLNLGAFMHNLFAQGAFQGKTPREAYFVKCDRETTTQNDVDLGRVNIVVGFAPLKPAEFVFIKIQQIAGAILT